MKYKENLSEERFTHLPFLKIKLRDNLSFETSLRQNSKEIKDETYKLLKGYEFYNLKKKIKNNEFINDNINDNSEILTRNRFKIFNINKIIKNRKKKEHKKIVKDLYILQKKEKYLALVKKYQLKNIIKTISPFAKNNYLNSLSNPDITRQNKTIKKTFSNKILNSNDNEDEINNSKSKIYKLEKTLFETKLNSKNIIEQINKHNGIKKIKKKEYLYKSAKALKQFEKLMLDSNNKEDKNINKKSRINYFKILDPIKKVNIFPLKKIKLNKKNSSNEILIKKSTVNLLLFGQIFNRMDDQVVFKNRKKILRDYPNLEKEANLIKAIYKDKSQYNQHGNNIEKNNKIIDGLIENNNKLYKSAYRKIS